MSTSEIGAKTGTDTNNHNTTIILARDDRMEDGRKIESRRLFTIATMVRNDDIDEGRMTLWVQGLNRWLTCSIPMLTCGGYDDD